MKQIGFYQKNRNLIFVILLLLIIGVIIAGCILMPTVFYDQWIWQYYWGPVVADEAGQSVTHNGIIANEGYTIVSEITYGIILVIALFLIYKLIKKLKITIDWKFCLALMPYILFGPVTRVLEDASYFNKPFVYWFISPFIYLQIAVYALGFLIFGYFLEKRLKKHNYKTILRYLLYIFVIVNVCYTLIWLFRVDYGLYFIHPVVFYLLSFLALLPAFYWAFKKKFTTNTLIFSSGLIFLLPSLYLIGRWIAGEQWGVTEGVRFDVFLLIMGLVALITGAVYLISRKFKDKEYINVYSKPLNLFMLAGHLVDGLTSYVSIFDPLNMGLPLYLEKHPASNVLMEIWPPLFPIVKFLLIIAVIAVFDILYKKELKNYQNLANLLKIGVLILGLSPGLRDLLRVTMGV